MTNLLDLPLDQFRGYLAEGNYPQARQDELMRAYRAQNSLSGLLDRYGEEGLEGKNVSTFFPVAGPSGMSIFDALKSGQLQTRFKDYASDALGGVIGALENPKASYDGTLPQADYDSAALGTAGLAMGGGGVAAGRNIGATNANASKSAGLLAASLPEPSKAQNAASKLSEQFGVDFDVSNHPTSYGNSTYVSGRIAGPDGTYTDVGFRLSDHETGDKRKATDDFLTIIDGDDVSAESLVAEVQSQFDKALPKMQKMSDDRRTKATAQADALSRWSELSGDERGEIAVKFKEIRPGYANGVPWKNLTKQQRADFAAREGLLAASLPNLTQKGLLQ